MAKLIPTKNKVMDTAKNSVKAGGLGGLAYGLGLNIAGPIGAAGGSVLAGSMIGGTDGKIVATNGIMELVANMFSGTARQDQGGAI